MARIQTTTNVIVLLYPNFKGTTRVYDTYMYCASLITNKYTFYILYTPRVVHVHVCTALWFFNQY